MPTLKLIFSLLFLIFLPGSFQQDPPVAITEPTNFGAQCVHRSHFTDLVPPICMQATDLPGYEYMYTDSLEPLRLGLLDFGATVLFASGPKCGLSSALFVCPNFLPKCTNVTVPGTNGTMEIAVRTYQCRTLCERLNTTCFVAMQTIFGSTPEGALAILNCYPTGVTFFYGNTTRDIFPEPAVRNPDPSLPSLNQTVVIPDINPAGTNITFNLTTTCFDDNIGLFLLTDSPLSCPDDGLVIDSSTGFCRFECPEPLIEDDEYLALEIIITICAIISLLAMLIMSIIYCSIYSLRQYPNTLVQSQFISIIGLSAAIIFGSFFDFHEGLWCDSNGEPNEWGNGWCTLQGIMIVYFSYASVLSWLIIIIRLFFSRGIILKPRAHSTAQVFLRFNTTEKLVWNVKWSKPLLWLAIKYDNQFLIRLFSQNPDKKRSSGDEMSDLSNTVHSIRMEVTKRDEDGNVIERRPVNEEQADAENSSDSDSSIDYAEKDENELKPLTYKIHAFFWIFNALIWLPPIVPIIIALANKQIGYGGADLWCNIHSGAAGSFVSTNEGIETDDDGEDNPWLLGTYIVPILCLILIGTIFVAIIILNTLYVVIYGMCKSGIMVLKMNKNTLGREGIDTIRLIIYAICMWVINIFSLLWLIYFNALRDEQYNKFADSLFCSFTIQSNPAVTDPDLCDPDKIISPVFWGFFATIFTGQGLVIALIFLSRGEILFACWSTARHGKPVITRSQHIAVMSGDPTSDAGGYTKSSIGTAREDEGLDKMQIRKPRQRLGRNEMDGFLEEGRAAREQDEIEDKRKKSKLVESRTGSPREANIVKLSGSGSSSVLTDSDSDRDTASMACVIIKDEINRSEEDPTDDLISDVEMGQKSTAGVVRIGNDEVSETEESFSSGEDLEDSDTSEESSS